MCGMSKWDFPDVLAQFDVNYIQYSYDDVMADVARIGRYRSVRNCQITINSKKIIAAFLNFMYF